MADGDIKTEVSANEAANTLANPMFWQASNGSAAGLNPGVGATDLGKAEDAVHVSGDTGVMMLGVRQDVQADFGADNDYVPFSIDANGALRTTGNATVTIDSEFVDDSAFVVGTDKVGAVGYLFDDVTPDSVDEGDIGIGRMSANRYQYVALRNQEQNVAVQFGDAGFVGAGPQGIPVMMHLDSDDSFQVPYSDVNGAQFVTSVQEDDGGWTPGSAAGRVFMAGFVADDTATDSVDENDAGAARMTLDRKQLIVLADPTTDANRLAINADGSINVAEAIVSSGSEVHDHDKSAATALAGTSNHDYLVANTTFLLSKVSIAGSGRMKAEIRTGTAAAVATDAANKLVLFKKRDETQPHEFVPAVPVPATGTGTVRIVRTQRSVGSLFMYSTIEGEDI